MFTPLMLAAAIVATSIAAAMIALLLLSSLPPGRRKPALVAASGPLEQAVFLFDDRELVDATGTARALLGAIPGQGSEWAKLASYLSQRLRGFETEMGTLADRGEVELRDETGDLRIRAEWLGQLARLTAQLGGGSGRHRQRDGRLGTGREGDGDGLVGRVLGPQHQC